MKDLIEEFEKEKGWEIREDKIHLPNGIRVPKEGNEFIYESYKADAYKALSEWLAKKLEEAREEVEKQKVHVKQTIENAKEADAIWRQELERVKGSVETLKKWIRTGQVTTSNGRSNDDLHTLINRIKTQ